VGWSKVFCSYAKDKIDRAGAARFFARSNRVVQDKVNLGKA